METMELTTAVVAVVLAVLDGKQLTMVKADKVMVALE